jgi:DHA2 family multidrug resistance protein
LGAYAAIRASKSARPFFIAGIFMTFSAPLAARLTTIIDQRIVMAVWFSLFALASWMMSGIASNWGFWELFVPQARTRSLPFFCASSLPLGSR